MHTLKRLFTRLVPEPRWVSTIYTVGYALVLCTGIVTLIYPPQTLTGAVGEVSMRVAASLWIVGGIIGMLTGWKEWWEWERLALWMMLTGIVFYGLIIWGLHVHSSGSRLTQLGVLTIAALFLILRFGFIWRYPFKPRG